MAGTTISIYDSPDSIGINDPETSIVVYEMFIGVGPTGATGATGPAGAAAVAGALPSEYVEMTTARTVTSETLVDITGVTADIVLDSTVNIAVFMNCEVSSDGECDLGLAISINGTDHDVVTTHLNGSTDGGTVAVLHRTATALAAGTYTVKGRFLRSSGTATPQVDRADFLVFGLQGAKGADSTVLAETTAENDFIVGDALNAWVTKTLAQTKTILGVTNAPNVATDATSDMLFGVANAWAKKTLAEGKTILGITNAPNVATTAANDFIVGSGSVWEKKTKLEAQTAMGVRVREFGGPISNPQSLYAVRPELFIKKTRAALTILSAELTLSDYSPTAEFAGDLMFADDMNVGGYANATLICALDTINGVVSVTSGFGDATVPSGKFIYLKMDASPHADIKDMLIGGTYSYDA